MTFSNQPTLCQAQASYKKVPGWLFLTSTNLMWSQDGASSPSLVVPASDATSLFCSKDGAAQVRLKLSVVGNEQGYTFTFISPNAAMDRDNFKRELSPIIARNRESSNSNAPPPPAAAVKPKQPPFRPSLPNAPSPAPTPMSRVPSTASSRAPSVPPGTRATDDFRLRKKVLMKTPELAALHRDLVMGGQITEAEFWEGREHLLLAEAAAENQKKGRSSQLVDPRPETVEGGDIKINLTPQLIHDIFEEYPIVQKAYNDNVPNPLSESAFWQRYFQSKLFNSNRASIRSAATQHVVKDDPIFDKYLQKEDDGLEPRRERTEHVGLFVNLLATQEDHGETGNQKDPTMQAGKQRAALPLIRKFNEHSERLLNSALGDIPDAKRRKLNKDGDHSAIYEPIDIDDLHDAQASNGVMLEMQDRQRYFEGQGSKDAQQSEKPSIDTRTAFQEAKNATEIWGPTLNSLKIEGKAGAAAVTAMTQNVSARLEAKSKKNDLPDSIFRQMTSCQTAANEFLRQFWSAMYPPPSDLQTLPSTPAQRAAKASKMAAYLSTTAEKVNAIIWQAGQNGIDAKRVELAFAPLMTSVDRALQFHSTRKLPR